MLDYTSIRYYPYGLKIAGISSKKIADTYDGQIKNNYLNQGAYSEMDDDISWNDFALRNYDPQIGRFVQPDPYGRFPGQYIGMGSNPMNLIDPSGGIGIPCPGTSQLAIFFMKAGETIGKGLNLISKISPWLSSGLNTAKIGVNIYNNSVQFKIINQQLTTNLTLQVGAANDGQNSTYWILYNGTEVRIYQGEYGDPNNSTVVESLGGTSGGDGYQNSSKQNESKKGPVPEGDYSIDLSIDPRNRKVSYNEDGETNEDVGIQQMVDKKGTGFNSAWGRWRARLEKDNANTTRDNFYFHDSYKGYSHGCIETETRLFYFFLSLHDAGVKRIKVKIDYPTNNSSTNGGTKYKPLIIPSNVVPYYKKYGYPSGAKGNKKYGKLPVPPAPYKYEPGK